MKDMEVNTRPLKEIFHQANFLSIPFYQRPFSWDKENFEDLIDDLLSADFAQDYFLGTGVFHKTSEPANYDIVDGQQRFTSLMILLACLRDRIEDQAFSKGIHEKIVQVENKVDSIPEKIRLTVKDHSIYHDLVVSEGGTLDLDKFQGLSEPESRYVLAVETYSQRLNLLSEDELQLFSQFLSQKCLIVVLSTTSFEEAFRLFTIVNDRGKQLRRIDVLKANNLSPTLIGNDGLREKLAATWENYENEIGEDRFESIINILRFMILKDKPQSDVLTEFEKRIFDKKLLIRGQPFLNRLFSLIDLYQSIFVDRDFCDDDEQENVKFRSLIHIMDSEFKASEWRALLLIYAEKFGKKKFYEFLNEVEQHYLWQYLTAVRKDERYSDYAKLLAAVGKAKNPDAAIGEIDYDSDEIVEIASAPIVYGKVYAKYLLLRLELSACEFERVHQFNARTIEHVFPQDPAEGSLWMNEPDIDDLGLFVHKLGNLVLLSKGKNSSASNLDFDDKKSKYLKPRVSDFPRSVQVLADKTWTRKLIEKRTAESAAALIEPI